MSNIVDIFKAGGIKPSELVGEKGFYTKEDEIYENSKLQQKFIPSIDYSQPANFARFGSAEEYYKQATSYISQYPYDGSSTEKLKWVNSLNDFEFHLYSNEYPRHTGSVQLTSSQKIEVYSNGKDESADIKELYSDGDKYRYNTYLDFAEGFTFESWIKLEDTSSVNILTISAYSKSLAGPYVPVTVLQISASSGQFGITDTYNTYTLPQSLAVNEWHHYAFTINTGSLQLFVDGQRTVDMPVKINQLRVKHVFTPFGLFILKLNREEIPPLNYQNTPSFILGGTGSVAYDDTRFWDGRRSIEKIGRFWFTHVDGNDKINQFIPEPTEPSLIFYYKYNEGYNADRAEFVIDSSGRKNDGIVINPSVYGFRSNESAFEACGFVQDTEQADVIVGSTANSNRLLSFYNEKISLGLDYDQNNIHSLYRKFPSWVLEAEEDSEIKHLKQLIQVVSVYFDDLYNKISEISQYKHQKLTDDTDKIYPFYDKILTSTGFDITELFSNLSGVEGVSSRDDLNLFDENTQKVKNQIYQNIYNNLAYILKSKGSEKSLKSLLRTYGVDENLVRINLYGDRSRYNVADKYKEKRIKKKTLALGGVQYVSSSAFRSLGTASAELQVFIPSSVPQKTSLLTLGQATAFLTASNGGLKLELSSSTSSSLSSEFIISDIEMPWNISLRYQDGLYELDALNFVTSGSYIHISASISGTQPNSILVGASGSYVTQQTVIDVALWNTYLDVDTLKVHARDITNYGIPDAKSLNDKIVLYWDFEKVTPTEVPDLFNTNNGQTNTDLTENVRKQSIKTYKTLNYDVLDADDTIQILDEDDIQNRSLLKKPSSTRLLIENSMYQIISDEMINMFSSISDYVFSFAEAGNLYKDSYKNLNKLRGNFFSKIINTPDIEKYVEFYKWLDSSLGYMLDQLKPENSNSSKGLKNTIESHMLERNKYQHKLPLTVAPNNTLNMSVSVLRNAGGADKGILVDSDNKKYSGMVQNKYVGPVENIQNKKGVNYNKNYEVLHTAGKQYNNRDSKELNKTVFQTVFSSGDGLSELSRDSVTGGEYSIYNSLLNKSKDVRDVLDYSSSLSTNIQTFVQLNTAIDLLRATELSASRIKYARNTKHVLCFTSSYYPLKIGNIVYIQEDLYETGGKLVTLSGYKIINAISSSYFVFDNDSNNTHTTDIDKLTPRGIWLLNAEKASISGDNLFVQRNIPYTASNYAHTTSVDYQQIPNEDALLLRKNNIIAAGNAAYREPPVEWNVPMYHDIKVVGAFENMEILSPYSSKVNDFANDALNTLLIGVDSKSDSGSFYRKIDSLDTGSIQINRIEHLENIFPKRTLMGLFESRTKVLYPEISGTFTNNNWSSDSYNRKTSGIRSFWSNNTAERRRTRGADTTNGTGSLNVANEYNFSSSASNIILEKTGSNSADQFMFARSGSIEYYIKLTIKNTINRYGSIYGMDSISTINYSGSQ